MAVSDTQPASVEDLQLLAQSLGREVLYAGAATSDNVYFMNGPSAFSDIELDILYNSKLYTKQVPCTVGKHEVSVNGHSVYYDIATYGNGYYIRQEYGYKTAPLFRVIGIRLGGGQLLADLIAALGGER